MEKYYFDLGVYDNGSFSPETIVKGHHIIKAESEKRALEIREKHGISNPRFAKGPLRISCKQLAPDDLRITRRQKGLGGSVWYEDENGNLQTEVI